MGPRVLLVEDEPALAQLLARFLVRAGYSPVLCANGVEALTHWDETCIAAVVDLGLPDIAGEDLIRQFVVRVPGRPIIISSGTPADTPSLQQYKVIKELSRIYFLQKPYRPGQLLDLIASFDIPRAPR